MEQKSMKIFKKKFKCRCTSKKRAGLDPMLLFFKLTTRTLRTVMIRFETNSDALVARIVPVCSFGSWYGHNKKCTINKS